MLAALFQFLFSLVSDVLRTFLRLTGDVRSFIHYLIAKTAQTTILKIRRGKHGAEECADAGGHESGHQGIVVNKILDGVLCTLSAAADILPGSSGLDLCFVHRLVGATACLVNGIISPLAYSLCSSSSLLFEMIRAFSRSESIIIGTILLRVIGIVDKLGMTGRIYLITIPILFDPVIPSIACLEPSALRSIAPAIAVFASTLHEHVPDGNSGHQCRHRIIAYGFQHIVTCSFRYYSGVISLAYSIYGLADRFAELAL